MKNFSQALFNHFSRSFKSLKFRSFSSSSTGRLFNRTGRVVASSSSFKWFLPTSMMSLLCLGYVNQAKCDSLSLKHYDNLTIIPLEYPKNEISWNLFINEVENSYPNRPIYVIFLADVQSGQSKRWCPDCVVAEPIIFSAFQEQLPNAVIVVCSVNRAEYKAPKYPYAINPSLKLSCVPTLLRWNAKTGLPDRLNDSQCQNWKLVTNFLNVHDGK